MKSIHEKGVTIPGNRRKYSEDFREKGENLRVTKKNANRHRTATTAYPCYLPVLGEFSRSWSCRLALQRYNTLT
jgi:hypothetical protein